jgi:hypothetical protein
MQRRPASGRGEENAPAVHPVFGSRAYTLFLVISLPQHIRGTLQASFDPESQVQAFFTSNSRPQVLQRYTSPSFMSQQFAIGKPPLVVVRD